MTVATVTASQINAYLTCPRMYYFRYVQKLVPKIEDPKLLFGKGVHRGLEVYYRTLSEDAAIQAYNVWLGEQREYLEGAGADLKLLQQASEIGEALLKEYFAYARQHDAFSVVAVEQEFMVPVWAPDGGQSGIWHHGRLDGVVRDRYGKLWLLEHKTARDFPSDIVLQLDLQVSYYLLAANQLFDDGICGVIYNVIRKVDPRKAKTPVISRTFVPRSSKELLTASAQLYRAAMAMLQDQHYDPSPGHHCAWKCAYSQLCLCLQDGTDSTALETNFYIRGEGDDELTNGIAG